MLKVSPLHNKYNTKGMEDSRLSCLQELPKANPIQKKVPVSPRSVLLLYPLPHFCYSDDIVDLAAPFNATEHQSVHNLPINKLS